MNAINHVPARHYAGIGSRQTPQSMLDSMVRIGEALGNAGWHLRSGYADGADQAFYRGACQTMGAATNFIPWAGFNGAPRQLPADVPTRFVVPVLTLELQRIAAAAHPNWNACTPAVQKLHARNVCQVLGEDLNTPSKMVVCWTYAGEGKGGTGQAIRIANLYGIPVFDLAREADQEAFMDFCDCN